MSILKPLDPYYRNFRDLSYLKNEEGLHLLPFYFFRSGKLTKLKKKEIAYLQSVDLRTVIDLRTPGEVLLKPDDEVPGAEIKVIPVLSQETLGITHERGLKKYKKPPVMPELYPAIVEGDDSIAALKQSLHIILDTEREGSILWHCTAGKDRGGLLTAFFLSALGYRREDIISDYCLSNARCEKQGRLYRIGVFIIKLDTKIAQAVYETMLAIPEYINSAFDAVDRKFGSMDRFIHDVLEIDDAMIARFKDKYMVAD